MHQDRYGCFLIALKMRSFFGWSISLQNPLSFVESLEAFRRVLREVSVQFSFQSSCPACLNRSDHSTNQGEQTKNYRNGGDEPR